MEDVRKSPFDFVEVVVDHDELLVEYSNDYYPDFARIMLMHIHTEQVVLMIGYSLIRETNQHSVRDQVNLQSFFCR